MRAGLTYRPADRPASGRPTAGRQVGLDRGRRPGGRRNGGFGGQRPPTENLNDFHNDFPPAGEAGGKIINDFLNDFPLAGRPAEKKPKQTITTTPPTTY